MFTGLVAGTGKLRARERRGPGYRLVIGTDGLPGFSALELGESISVNGACLTVVSQSATSFDADVSVETVEKTTLGRLSLGAELNLERSLRVGDRLGGHYVSGHVDCVAHVVAVEEQGEGWLVRVRFGEEQRRFIAEKGSVALDGASLTVNAVVGLELHVMLIPHTRQVTALKHWKAGTELNLEVDLAARYLVRYFEVTGQKPPEAADASFDLALERAGYK
ncbi:MAG: riboflavin synthase [Polyangiaceae bacterium]|jgi:riboflavin synthase|nr:riboflavin synthase [Polyangiaceae bacterium]